MQEKFLILELREDIRKIALEIEKTNPEINYAEASAQAEELILGKKNTRYLSPTYEIGKSKTDEQSLRVLEHARKELPAEIDLGLYSEEQLKQLMIANKTGVNVMTLDSSFSAEQIMFITIVSGMNMDITPFINNSNFDPQTEYERLNNDQGTDEGKEEDKVYVYAA